MIIPVQAQLKGEKEPRRHLALVFPDADVPEDFILYRNAATQAVKAILGSPDIEPCLTDEMYWLIQFSEFISSSLDMELRQRKGGSDG